jgi:hypothetical protein
MLAVLSYEHQDGVNAAQIAREFEAKGTAITERQVRAALKQLTKFQAVIRASRGRYLPAPETASGGEPGTPVPGPVAHQESVVAVIGGSKWGGT